MQNKKYAVKQRIFDDGTIKTYQKRVNPSTKSYHISLPLCDVYCDVFETKTAADSFYESATKEEGQ